MSLSLLSWIPANGLPTAVDSVRVGYENASANWFRLVKYAGYAVAGGCVLEAPETFIQLKRWILLRFRGIDHKESDKDRKSLFIPAAALGLFIVVAGIVAETYFEGRVSNVESALRTHESDKIIAAETDAANATRDAGTAKQSAIDAQTASGKAVTDSGTAESTARDASVKASDARAEADQFAAEIANAKSSIRNLTDGITDLTAKTASANAVLDAEVQKVSDIEKDILPRRLRYVSINGIENVAPLRRFGGMKVEFAVSPASSPDSEPRKAAGSLAGLLKDFAHWQIVPQSFAPEYIHDGVLIEYPFGERKDACAAHALLAFLKENNWGAREFFVANDSWSQPSPDDPLPPNTLRIVVGDKPDLLFDRLPPEMQRRLDAARERNGPVPTDDCTAYGTNP